MNRCGKGEWACSEFRHRCSRKDNDAPCPSSSVLFALPLTFLLSIRSVRSSSSRSHSISFTPHDSMFPQFTRAHTHICMRIGAKCSICKIAEYGRKTQAACMPIWRAVAATLFHSFPFLCESANTDGKIEILTLTLHPRNVHRIPTLCHCRCPPAISVFHSWKLALNYGEIRLGSLLLKLFTLRVLNYL